MRAINFKKVLIAVCAVLLMLVTSIGLSLITPKQADAQVIEVGDIVESRIVLNTEVEIPASVSVEYEGTRTANNGVIVFPDGNIVNAGKVRLNQAGAYQLRYFFDLSGVSYTVVQNIEVYSEYYNLSNPNGGEIIVSDAENPLYCGKDGIIANLKSGTTFLYNKVVDLRQAGEDGLSNIIEIDARYGHFEDGVYTPDCLEAWVRVTDCYNPNLYIELRMQNAYLYNGALYPGVRTNSQPVTGMDKGITQVLGSSRIIQLDGFNYRVWQKEGSMNVGLYNMSTQLTTGAVWKYDMATKRVYLTYNNKENFLVTDLDEPLIYTDGAFFSGFTTGEVYVSVYANGYESAVAQTEIISIGNDNLKAISGQSYVDNVAPQITVDQVKTTETGVYGAVGDTFAVPSATARDVNLVGGVDVAVYRGYGTKTQTNVSVVNGKFTMNRKDLYTIVYTAKDKTGNVGTEIFTVSALNTDDSRAITLNLLKEGNISAGEPVTDLYEVVNSINLPTDEVKVSIKVESEKQTLTGKGKDFSFTPYFAGDYTLTFTYTDGVFEYEKSVTLRCENSSNVCFMDEIISPRYYLKGYDYAIEDVKAYTFVNGYPEAVQTKIYAIFDNGAAQEVTNPSKVTMTGNSSVYFKYVGPNGETLTTDATTILNVEYKNAMGRVLGYDMGKLFVGDFSYNALKEGKRTKNITFTSNVEQGDNTLSYFKEISGRRFSLEYKVVSNEDKFSTFRINLTDSKNPDNKLVAEIVKGADGTYIGVNGGALKKEDGLAFTNEVITVSYEYDSKFLRINNFSCSVDFDASLVYLDMDMVDINGKASVLISSLNAMSIAGNNYKDGVEPDIYATDFQGDYAIGDTFTVSAPEYSDVVSGIDYTTATVKITCSDGGTVYLANGKAVNNAELVCGEPYEIKLDRLAKFYVIYEIKDFSGNTFTKTVTVNCADTELPTVALEKMKDGDTLKVKVGEEIQFNFNVSDNVSLPKNIIVYIHLYCIDQFSYVPNVTNISGSKEDGVYKEKLTISIKGNYQAQIFAQDEEGNYRTVRINITVE